MLRRLLRSWAIQRHTMQPKRRRPATTQAFSCHRLRSSTAYRMDRSGDMGSPTPYARQLYMSRSVLLQNSQLTGPPDGSSVDHALYPRPVRELIGPLRTSTPPHESCQGSGPGAWRRSLPCASQISPPQSLHASRHTLLRDQGPPHSWPLPSLSAPGSLLPAPGRLTRSCAASSVSLCPAHNPAPVLEDTTSRGSSRRTTRLSRPRLRPVH